MKKTIGIIGGMDPLATCEIYKKISEHTAADSDHTHVIIDSDSSIPDRTSAILNGGASPVPAIIKSAKNLEAAGADFLIMPSNTAHYFHGEIQESITIPILHMIRETALELKYRDIKKVGLLATNGTLQTGIYESALAEFEIECIAPEQEYRRAIMGLIYNGVKSGNHKYDTSEFIKTAESLFEAGAQMLVLGATELPRAFDIYGLDYPHIDPTMALCDAAIRFAGYRVIQQNPLLIKPAEMIGQPIRNSFFDPGVPIPSPNNC